MWSFAISYVAARVLHFSAFIMTCRLFHITKQLYILIIVDQTSVEQTSTKQKRPRYEDYEYTWLENDCLQLSLFQPKLPYNTPPVLPKVLWQLL